MSIKQTINARHLMVDLETLSSASDAAIISIGAVCFDRDGIVEHSEFHVNIWSLSPLHTELTSMYRKYHTGVCCNEQERTAPVTHEIIKRHKGFASNLINVVSCNG